MTREQLLNSKPQSEDALQAMCHLYLNKNYKPLRGLCFSIPNGGSRHKLEAMKMQATGLVAGEPDYLIMLPAPHQPLAIEFKDGTKYKHGQGLSPAQKTIHQKWYEAGRAVHLVYTPAGFICICDMFIPDEYYKPI